MRPDQCGDIDAAGLQLELQRIGIVRRHLDVERRVTILQHAQGLRQHIGLHGRDGPEPDSTCDHGHRAGPERWQPREQFTCDHGDIGRERCRLGGAAGTPAIVVGKLDAEINRALQAPDVRANLESNGVDVRGGTSEQFGTFLEMERAKWARAVKASGARVD